MTDIVVHGEDAAEGVASDIAQTVGEVKAHTEHAAEDIAEHTEQLADVKRDAEWTSDRLSSLESTAFSLPTQLVETEERLKSLIVSSVDSLREELSTPPQESGESTEPPPETVNKLTEKPKGMLERAWGGLKKLL